MKLLTDTHCHLDFEAFNEDRESVLERAWRTGISRILIPGIDVESSKKVADLASRQENLFAAVGVHPNSALIWNSGAVQELRALGECGKVIAVGEIGLDYFRDHAPHVTQQAVLRDQLELAAEIDLPVILHNRDATEDLLEILAEWQANLVKSGKGIAERPGVLHSFSGNYTEAVRAMDLGFYIGITGPVTFKNAPELHELVARLPLDRLLIETDSPFLAPHPFRGKRNEPAYVRLVAEKISELQGIPPAEVGRVTSANAERLFRW